MKTRGSIIITSVAVLVAIIFSSLVINHPDNVEENSYVEPEVSMDIYDDITTEEESVEEVEPETEPIHYNITVINPSDNIITPSDGYTCWFVNFELQNKNTNAGGGTGCFMIESTEMDFPKLETEILKERGGTTSIITFYHQITYNTYRSYNIAYGHPYK